MAQFIVKKSMNLKGNVAVSGSKNASLPLLAATVLTEEPCTLCEIPDLSDIRYMNEILTALGTKVKQDGDTYQIDNKRVKSRTPSYELMTKLRASFLIAGPLLAKTGRAKLSLPGGCRIGLRPVDLHLKGFAALGAKITQEHGFIDIKARQLSGSKIYLDFPSVGATENLLMCSCLAQGETILENAATEPEIVDLAHFLTAMGAKIHGAGTDTIRIEGVESLHGAQHTVIPDRIEAGTFMVLAALTKGDIEIFNVIPDHVKPMTAKLREIGAQVIEDDLSLRVRMEGKSKAADIKTLPYPGFPTDMQAQFASLLSLADGNSILTESIFENRFMHVSELKRMGADIKIEGRTAVISGVKKLTGATVCASDLRAGAALVLAGLAAEGETIVQDIAHIERGYFHFDEKLKGLGAQIERMETPNDSSQI